MSDSKPRPLDGSDLAEGADEELAKEQRALLLSALRTLRDNAFDDERVRRLLRIAFADGGAVGIGQKEYADIEEVRKEARPWATLLAQWHRDHDELHRLLLGAEHVGGDLTASGRCLACKGTQSGILRAHASYGRKLAAEVSQWERFLREEADATDRFIESEPRELRIRGGIVVEFEEIGVTQKQMALIILSCDWNPERWPPSDEQLDCLPFDEDEREPVERRIRSWKFQYRHHERVQNPVDEPHDIEGLGVVKDSE